MEQYLLDTNICVFLLRDKYGIGAKLKTVGPSSCHISEVTVAELQYGVECSSKREANKKLLDVFMQGINVIPFQEGVTTFAKEKARLRSLGKPVENFDLFIGCTAKAKRLTLVTDNTRHFDRIEGIKIENWVNRD